MVYITYISEKIIITHQEPIKGIKVSILHGYPISILGYPSNILGYQSKYCNYTSKKKLGRFPIPPGPPPKWKTLLIFISQKILYY